MENRPLQCLCWLLIFPFFSFIFNILLLISGPRVNGFSIDIRVTEIWCKAVPWMV